MPKVKPTLPDRICEFCKDRYTPVKKWQKYCDKQCQWMAWDKNNPRVKRDERESNP